MPFEFELTQQERGFHKNNRNEESYENGSSRGSSSSFGRCHAFDGLEQNLLVCADAAYVSCSYRFYGRA
jgi:hypothetical protein